jgi:hypothetical protein
MNMDHITSGLALRESVSGMKQRRVYNLLQRGLGIFWVIAGILQFQPLMFTTDFYAWYPSKIMESTIQSVADGQPTWVVTLVHTGSTVWSMSPIFFNVSAALIQLVTGILLIFGRGRMRELGMLVAVGWGLLVWIFGEAFGGLFGGSTYFDGVPGAAVLYVITAIILYFHRNSRGRSLTLWIRYMASLFWFAMALLQAIPSSGFWSSEGLMEPFANSAALPQPGIISRPIQWFSLMIPQHAVLINFIIVILLTAMGLLTLLNHWRGLTMGLALLFILWSWWFGQDLGAIFSSAGTDVNSIPVIGLWMVALWQRNAANG